MTAKPNPPVSPVEAKVGKTRARKPLAELSKNTLRTVPPIKWSQRCAYKTDEWRHHYGMRSLVEYSNSLLKSAMQGGVDKKEKRSGRGYAAVYLALAFAVVASNLRRILTS